VGAFFLCGLAFLILGAAAGTWNAAAAPAYGRWLALHLIFVGGISQLILGASQFFTGAFLATDPPPRWLARGQVLTWNAGTLALAAGVPLRADGLAAAGAVTLLASLALYAFALWDMRRRSLRDAPWATRWYGAGALFFGVGITAGLAMVLGWRWSAGDLLAAHMSLNLAGWFGAAIVGTLHTFYPSMTQTALPFPRLQRWTWLAWVAGVGGLAAGYGLDLDRVSAAGWILLLVAAILLVVNVAGCLRRARLPLSLPARLVGLGQAFLVLGLLVIVEKILEGDPALAFVGPTRAAGAALLVLGWIGLTVLGSLVHLLAVLVRVRNLARPMPAARPRRDLAVAALAGLGVAGLGLAERLELGSGTWIFLAPALVAYGVIAVSVLQLGARVLLRARPAL
jgi:nitrite reductase (NO-forming)